MADISKRGQRRLTVRVTQEFYLDEDFNPGLPGPLEGEEKVVPQSVNSVINRLFLLVAFVLVASFALMAYGSDAAQVEILIGCSLVPLLALTRFVLGRAIKPRAEYRTN
jgi:hypothetical protein